MKRWRNLSAGVMLALMALTFFVVGLTLTAASPGALEPGGVLVPLGTDQADVRAAYAEALGHLYDGGRLHRLAAATSLPTQPGDLYVPPGEVVTDTFCAACSRQVLAGATPLTRAYALRPGRVALFRSSVTYTLGNEGEAVAMWEYAVCASSSTATCAGGALHDPGRGRRWSPTSRLRSAHLAGSFNADARTRCWMPWTRPAASTPSLPSWRTAARFTPRAQGCKSRRRRGCCLLAPSIPTRTIALGRGGRHQPGPVERAAPDSPLAWRWRTETLYVLDDPLLTADESVEVIAEFTNVRGTRGSRR